MPQPIYFQGPDLALPQTQTTAYQCPPQQPCPPCANPWPGFMGTMIGLSISMAFWNKKRFDPYINKEVEKRLAALQQATRQTSETDSFKQLESRLINLMHGDQAAVIRLVQLIKSRHPSQSAKWCYEKAIEDLERDRR